MYVLLSEIGLHFERCLCFPDTLLDFHTKGWELGWRSLDSLDNMKKQTIKNFSYIYSYGKEHWYVNLNLDYSTKLLGRYFEHWLVFNARKPESCFGYEMPGWRKFIMFSLVYVYWQCPSHLWINVISIKKTSSKDFVVTIKSHQGDFGSSVLRIPFDHALLALGGVH